MAHCWRCGEDIKLTLSNNLLHVFNGLIKLSGLHLDWVGSHFQLLNYETEKYYGYGLYNQAQF